MTSCVARVALTSLAVLALGACGDGAAAPPRESPRADPAPEPSPPTGAYTLHEWGFIAASHDGLHAAVSGPRGLSASAPALHAPGLGLGGLGVGAGGKPVLYFHLDEGVSELALSVGVRPAGGGQLLEHFPQGELSGDQRTLRWTGVRITRGACRGTYPGLTDARCQTSDGLCELAELSGYESASADCVNVGEQRTGLLFYRSGPARATLPLTVSRAAEDVVHVSHAAPPGPARVRGLVMRIARGEERAQTRVDLVEVPDEGYASARPVTSQNGVTADEAIRRLRSAILAAGLDEPEADAFMAAWTDALFGALPRPAPPPGPVGTIGLGSIGFTQRHPLGSVAESIVYILPQDSVDALLPLELTPAPRSVRRVFLARVALAVETLRLTLQTPIVRGPLPREVVRRVLRRHSSGLRQCLPADVALGRLTLNLRVLPTGMVESVAFEGVDIGDAARRCLLAYGQRISFPADDVVTTVAQPMLISR